MVWRGVVALLLVASCGRTKGMGPGLAADGGGPEGDVGVADDRLPGDGRDDTGGDGSDDMGGDGGDDTGRDGGDTSTGGDASAGGDGRCAAATITARLPLFGGNTNNGVATDGVRYLFPSLNASVPITVATPTGPGGALEVRARVDAGNTTNVVTVGDGRFFFVSGTDGVLLDAGDPAAPREVWRQPLALPVAPPPANWVVAAYSAAPTLVVAAGGVLYHYERTFVLSDGSTVMRGGPFFIPIGEAGPGPAVSVNDSGDGASIDRVDADGDVVTWTGSVPVHGLPGLRARIKLTWGRIDAAGHLVERADFDPWDWPTSYAQNSWSFQASGGRVALGGQFSVAVGTMVAPIADPPPCDDSSQLCEDLTPGCGSPALPLAGRYAECGPDAGSCAVGAICVQRSVDGGAAGCDAPTWVCVSTGQRYPDVVDIPFGHTGNAGNALLDGDFLFISNAYVGTKGYDVREASPAEVDIDAAAQGVFQRNPGHLVFAESWLAYALRRDPSIPIAAPLATQRFTRVTGPGHGDANLMAHAASGDLLVSGIPSVGTADLAAGRWTGWRLLDAVGPLMWGTWVVRGADRDVALDSGLGPQGWSSACGGWQGLAAVVIAEDGAISSHPFCSPGDGLPSGRFVSAGDRLLFTAWPNQRLVGWDLTSSALQPFGDVVSGIDPQAQAQAAARDDGGEVAIFGSSFAGASSSFAGADVRIYPARPFAATPTQVLRLSPDQVDSRAVFKWWGPRLLAVNRGTVHLVRLDGAPEPPPLPLDPGGVIGQIWMRDARAFASLRTTDGSYTLVQLAAGDGLQELARFPLPSAPNGLLDDGDRVAVSTASDLVIIAPGCQ
jgi:hypothetical protein